MLDKILYSIIVILYVAGILFFIFTAIKNIFVYIPYAIEEKDNNDTRAFSASIVLILLCIICIILGSMVLFRLFVR